MGQSSGRVPIPESLYYNWSNLTGNVADTADARRGPDYRGCCDNRSLPSPGRHALPVCHRDIGKEGARVSGNAGKVYTRNGVCGRVLLILDLYLTSSIFSLRRRPWFESLVGSVLCGITILYTWGPSV